MQARDVDLQLRAPLSEPTVCDEWRLPAIAHGHHHHEAMNGPVGGLCETRGRAAEIQSRRASRADAGKASASKEIARLGRSCHCTQPGSSPSQALSLSGNERDSDPHTRLECVTVHPCGSCQSRANAKQMIARSAKDCRSPATQAVNVSGRQAEVSWSPQRERESSLT